MIAGAGAATAGAAYATGAAQLGSKVSGLQTASECHLDGRAYLPATATGAATSGGLYEAPPVLDGAVPCSLVWMEARKP